MSMMSKCPCCGHTFHIQAQLTQLVTFITSGHTCHMCQMWSHLSLVVTPVTCVTLLSEKPMFLMLTKKFVDYDNETRPTYRPARPQVKINIHRIRITFEMEKKKKVVSSSSGLRAHLRNHAASLRMENLPRMGMSSGASLRIGTSSGASASVRMGTSLMRVNVRVVKAPEKVSNAHTRVRIEEGESRCRDESASFEWKQ